MAIQCTELYDFFLNQVPVLKRYPARLSVLSLTCIFGLLQFLVIAVFTEEDLSRWKVHSGGELFTILYAVKAPSNFNLLACQKEKKRKQRTCAACSSCSSSD